jgi:hypothetical protein
LTSSALPPRRCGPNCNRHSARGTHGPTDPARAQVGDVAAPYLRCWLFRD